MTTIRGITVKIGAETSGLQAALKDVNKQSRNIAAELRKVERGLKFNPKNTELLAQKKKLLGDQVAATREKLDRLRAVQGQVDEQFRKGEIPEAQYRAFKREIVETESKLRHFEGQLRETGLTAEQLGKKLQGAGRKLADVGKNLSMKITAPILGLGAAASKAGIDFEAAISEVGAISGATGEDLAALEAKAKEMGATTKFSASEAAEGLKYMAMAGWDTQQQLDALPGVLNLAAASGEELGLVSDIMTDAMTAFCMEAGQAGEFADVLAAASSNANTNVGMLGESFKYVAPVAGALGFEARDTAVALGLMANAGIKSSQAGTALRTMMTNLAKPTDAMQKAMDKYGISLTNADGSMKSLDEVMLNLRESLGGLTEAEQAAAAATIFGKEAMSGALAIVNASEEDYNKLSDSINDSAGAAERMAKEMQDNLQGRLTELKSAIEGVALQLYDAMLPALEKVVAVIQKVVNWFARLSPEVKATIVVVAGLAAAVGPLLVVLGLVAQGLGAVIGAVGAVSGALAAAGGAAGVFGGIFAALTGPIGVAVAAIAGVAVAGKALHNHLKKESIPAIELFGDEVSENTQQAVGGFLKLNDEATKALNQLSWSGQEVTKEMADGITGNISKMASQVQGKLDEHHKESLSKIQGFVKGNAALSKEEQEEILSNMKQGHEDRKKEVADGEARIKEILETASNEKRAITREEQEEINSIQQHMVETGIQVLSESEVEANAIMERMKAQAGEITATQAAEVVKNSLAQKEGAIEAAEDQYNDVIKEIIRQRDEAGTISKEQADKLIKNATRQKDDAIKQAESMHKRVVKEAKSQAKEHVNEVDWETGEIKTKWEMLKGSLGETWTGIGKAAKNKWDDLGKFFKKWGETILLLAVGPVGWAVLLGKKLAKNWDTIKGTTSAVWTSIKNTLGGTWNSILSTASSVWSRIKNSIVSPIREAQNVLNGIIRSIKSAFANMRIEIPRPKLPRVNVDWQSVGFGDASVNIPKFNLNWYAQGGIFDQPSIIGVGEAGKEAVIPLDKLPGMIAGALREALRGNQVAVAGGITVQNMYVRNDQDIKLVARELYNLQQQNARGRGLR